MSTEVRGNPLGGLSGLRRLRREREPAERCELCGEGVNADHSHLYEPKGRQLVCSCRACGMLFPSEAAGRYRLVPREIRLIRAFQMPDELWDELLVPVNMAFFQRSSAAGRVVAYYPGPAGATESQLTLEAWNRLEVENPSLQGLEVDVRALLVNRVMPEHEYYLAPIDECYRLCGIIRGRWRGLSGGTEVWKAISAFFTDLRARAMTDA